MNTVDDRTASVEVRRRRHRAPGMTGRPMLVAAFAVSALLIGACGGDEESTSTSTAVETSSGDAVTTTLRATTTVSSSAPPSTSGGGSSTTLPGQDIESVPGAGDGLSVVAVAHDDVLNVQAVPGAGGSVAATADPLADDLIATGSARSLPGSIWYEVRLGAVSGWVNSRYVAFAGGTDDMTAEFLAAGHSPAGKTLTGLGEFIAATVASSEPESRIVQTTAPAYGDLGEVTYDVIGVGDDAIAGFRLHIFAIEREGGERYEVRSIERTTFCSRGIDGGSCV